MVDRQLVSLVAQAHPRALDAQIPLNRSLNTPFSQTPCHPQYEWPEIEKMPPREKIQKMNFKLADNSEICNFKSVRRKLA
jgi:hypothetical protein